MKKFKKGDLVIIKDYYSKYCKEDTRRKIINSITRIYSGADGLICSTNNPCTNKCPNVKNADDVQIYTVHPAVVGRFCFCELELRKVTEREEFLYRMYGNGVLKNGKV